MGKVHSSVALDRIVLWLGWYKGDVKKAKENLLKYGFQAIDELWDEGLERWRRKYVKEKKKEMRLQKMTVTLNVKGKKSVTVVNGVRRIER